MYISLMLVILQVFLIAMIASPITELFNTHTQSLVGLVLIALSGLLAVASLLHMQAGTFTIMPEPSRSSSLTTTGPYGYVRHPMYSAVLLGAVGASIAHAETPYLILTAALACVLLVKIRREESLLSTRYPEYAAYKLRTKKIIPYLH